MKKALCVMVGVCFLMSSSLVWGSGHKSGKADACDLYSKFYEECMVALKNSDKIGLEDSQKEAIKNMKYDAKKEKIKACAQIDLLSVNISEAMWKKDVDVDEVNALIDEKYQKMAQLKKGMLANRLALNDILTEEQRGKVGEIRKKYKYKGKYMQCDEGMAEKKGKYKKKM